MIFYSLASSSSGNAYIYDFGNTKILVDVGINYKNLKNKMENINLSFADIDAILISHEHSDHIKGLEVLVKNEDIDLYMTKGTSDVLKFDLERKNHIESGMKFNIKEVNIKALSTSHDAIESLCFLFEHDKKEYAHITDTGYISIGVQKYLQNLHFYLIESNYDEKALLINEKYPYYLKKRISSDRGHLSNVQTNEYIKDFIGDNTKVVCFGHLSEKNNDPELVEILNENIPLENKHILAKDEVIKVLCK